MQYDARYTQLRINTRQFVARYTQRHINTMQYDARYVQRQISVLAYVAWCNLLFTAYNLSYNPTVHYSECTMTFLVKTKSFGHEDVRL